MPNICGKVAGTSLLFRASPRWDNSIYPWQQEAGSSCCPASSHSDNDFNGISNEKHLCLFSQCIFTDSSFTMAVYGENAFWAAREFFAAITIVTTVPVWKQSGSILANTSMGSSGNS